MYNYSIVPSDYIKKRMDFFYTPYNKKFLLRKHMTFESCESSLEHDEESCAVTPPPMKLSCFDIEAQGVTI